MLRRVEAKTPRIKSSMRSWSAWGCLQDTPRLGKLRPDLGDDLRSLPVNLYIVYYREAHQAIQIARVLHASRDQAVSLDETSTEP